MKDTSRLKALYVCRNVRETFDGSKMILRCSVSQVYYVTVFNVRLNECSDRTDGDGNFAIVTRLRFCGGSRD